MFSRNCALLLALTAVATRAASVAIIPADFHGASQPQVAVSAEGRVHVVFGKEGAVYHVASADNARTFSPPVLIGKLPKLALGMRRGPRIAASDKLITVSAISHDDGDLHAWNSNDNGATWSAGKNVNEVAKSAREGLHAMAGDGKGLVAAAWLDLRNGGTEIWSAVSRDAGASWIPNVQIYKSPDGHVCECCHPSVAIDARGGIAVMFRNWLGGSRDMYLATSVDSGKTFGAAEKLGSGTWKLQGCPMDGGALAFNAAGKPTTVWRREKAVLAADGPAAEQRLADSALQPIVVPLKSGAAYLWQQGPALMLQRGGSAPARFVESGAFPASASAPDGSAIIVWESGSDASRTLFAATLK